MRVRVIFQHIYFYTEKKRNAYTLGENQARREEINATVCILQNSLCEKSLYMPSHTLYPFHSHFIYIYVISKGKCSKKHNFPFTALNTIAFDKYIIASQANSMTVHNSFYIHIIVIITREIHNYDYKG